ncbi:MAG: hypothetical protein ABS79_03885 [Planctomycetes bacterium SCN 63-9]|nr:MAG: hypothetical protein ABS79_03885 [Planctomycetes bacterium SCN 63-9]
MDIYLEAQGHWESFHAMLIAACAEVLNRDLPGSYVAQVESRISLIGYDEPDVASERIADVSVGKRNEESRRSPTIRSASSSSSSAVLEPTMIPLAKRQIQVREHWIEILKLPELNLVTIIEVLSPSNKAGAGRADYLLKRNDLIDRETINLVEIDLLLGGSRMPMSRSLPAGDYYAIVARAEHRPDAEVYAWSIRRPLPTVPIPLHAPDDDAALQLGEVVSLAYDRGGFARLLRYHEPLPTTLPIDPTDRLWADRETRPGGD